MEEKGDLKNSVTTVVKANPVRKRYGPANARVLSNNKIPDKILKDPKLEAAVSILPQNYEFEIYKSVWRVQQTKAKCVALQFPEGLLMFSCIISDIIETFTDAETVIMADVTYGACCVDDYSARALGCDFMIHYGHSCLVPISNMPDMKMLYVFVHIKIDNTHFNETLKHNFEPGSKVVIVSTVQFINSLKSTQLEMAKHGIEVVIPQCKPLSPGEVLGCTSSRLASDYNADALVFLGDGRFHLESIMISNPTVPAYCYDPYSKKFTLETYDHVTMLSNRKTEIDKAAKGKSWGLILGTLGRQGSPKVLKYLENSIKEAGKEVVTVLLSEILPEKLKLFTGVDAWVQTSCPRLSIDWGTAYDKPLLNPYEASVALKKVEFKQNYPMDFYANESTGPWTPNNSSYRPPPKPRMKINKKNITT